jgi:hypothetical protein
MRIWRHKAVPDSKESMEIAEIKRFLSAPRVHQAVILKMGKYPCAAAWLPQLKAKRPDADLSVTD